MKEKFSLVLFVTLVLLTFTVGSTCIFSNVRVGKEKLERIENPYPYKSGSTDLLSSTGVSVGLSNGTPSDHLQFADVNGDGLADALYFDTLSSNKVYVALSNGIDSFGTPTQWWQHEGSTPDMIQYADVNGDNKTDAIYFDTFRSRGVWVGLSNGIDGFNKPGSGMWWQHGGSTPDMIQYADVDGDNKVDAIYFDTFRSRGVWVGLSNGIDGFTKPGSGMWWQLYESTPDMIQFADVDGDNRADAIYFDTLRTMGVWVGLSNGIDGFNKPGCGMWWQHGVSTPDMIQYADIDGDNKTDAIYFDTFRTMGVWVGLSNGINGFTKPGSGMWWQHGESTPDMIQYADVNGDNKTDAIYFDTLRSTGVWVGLSDGSNGFNLPGSGMWQQHGESTPDMIQYADVNGDNMADAIYFDTLRSKGVWVGLSNGVNGFNALGSGEWGHFDL